MLFKFYAGVVGLSLELVGPTGWFYRDGMGTTATSGLVLKDWVGGWLLKAGRAAIITIAPSVEIKKGRKVNDCRKRTWDQ